MIRRRTRLLSRPFGIALVVTGTGLGFWAWRLSQSLGSRLTEVLSGAPADKVMWLYIGAAASVATGLWLLSRR